MKVSYLCAFYPKRKTLIKSGKITFVDGSGATGGAAEGGRPMGDCSGKVPAKPIRSPAGHLWLEVTPSPGANSFRTKEKFGRIN